MLDAEAVLLVDDNHAEVEELDVVLNERMGTDDDPGVAGHGFEQRCALRSDRQRAGKKGDTGGMFGRTEFTTCSQRAHHLAQ